MDRRHQHDGIGQVGNLQPRQRVAQARNRRRVLHAEHQPVVRLVVIGEDGAREGEDRG
ncbi:MAG: hypothetical protein H0X69_13090 [Gemmatimonadales bacterium]|nr:hypothetical protein [Gemmatimonadales bacterium]